MGVYEMRQAYMNLRDEPCVKYDCKCKKYCTYARLACESFARYVSTGRVFPPNASWKDPNCLSPTGRGKALKGGKKSKTRKIYFHQKTMPNRQIFDHLYPESEEDF